MVAPFQNPVLVLASTCTRRRVWYVGYMFEWLKAIVTLAGRLTTLETQVQRTKDKVATLELQFTAALAEIDAETNRIAAVLEDLKGQITGQGIPAVKEAEILALLSAQVTKLKGVGAAPVVPPVPAGPVADSGAGSGEPTA